MMEFRELMEQETETALELAWRVFQEFEAPDYDLQGIAEFKQSIHDPQYLQKLRWYGAWTDRTLIGVLATRSEGAHIALFFVDGSYHRQGIGRKLFESVVRDNRTDKITVNASPYAVPVYHRLGFQDTDAEQCSNGIRYIPMEFLHSSR